MVEAKRVHSSMSNLTMVTSVTGGTLLKDFHIGLRSIPFLLYTNYNISS